MTGLAQNSSTAEFEHRLNLFQKKAYKVYASIKKSDKTKKFALAVLISGSALILGCQSIDTQQPMADLSSSSVGSKGYKGTLKNSYSAKQAAEVAAIRTQMAAEYIKQNKLDDAKRQLEKALQANKHHAPAYDMMGVLLQKEGSRLNIIAAESYFQRAIALAPKLMQTRNNYGVYLSQLGRYEEAIDQFEVAGSALGYKGRIKALENLGLTALQADNYSLATASFVRILERDRNNLVAHIELVDLLIISNQLGQAKNLYNETLVLLGAEANQIPRLVTQGAKLGHQFQPDKSR